MNNKTTNTNMTRPTVSEDTTLTAKEDFIISFVGFSIIALILFLLYYCCYAIADGKDVVSAVSFSDSFEKHFTWDGFKHFFKHYSLLKAANGWGFFRVVLHDLSGMFKPLFYLLIAAITISVIVSIFGHFLPIIGGILSLVIGIDGIYMIWTGITGGGFKVVLSGIGMLVLAGVVNSICTYISTHLLGYTEEELNDTIAEGIEDSY